MPSKFARAAVAAGAFASSALAFDASSSKNVAVYWGQGSSQIDLSTVCSDESVDIVNLAFVNQFPLKVGDYPATNFANACGEEFYAYKDGTLSGLRSHCPGIGPGIKTCHDNGKKVLLSIGGGWPTNYYLPSIEVAEYFAEFLYGAFGPATPEWIAAGKPRPFGDDVAVDGFDLDLEAYMNPAPSPDYLYANYDSLVNHLKVLDSSLLISGAPQCITPDVRLAEAITNSPFDFVYVQFYNTPECSSRAGYNGLSDVSKTTFTFDDWVAFLKSSSSNPAVKLYLGLPAGIDGAPNDPTSYLTPAEAQKLISYYSGHHADIFGGVMLWEATVSSRNKICDKPYASWIKDILTGYYTAPTCASTTSSIASSTTVTASSTSSGASVTPTATSPDGSCGGTTGYTCIGYHNGECCSQWGYCGGTSDYCDAGCQSHFGKCGSSSSSSSSSSSAASTTSSASRSSSSVSSSVSSSSSSASSSSVTSSHSSSASTTASSSSSTYSVGSSSSSSASSSSYSVGSSSSSSASSSTLYPTGGSSTVYTSGSATSKAPYPTGNATTPCTTSTASSSVVYPASSSTTPYTTSTGNSTIAYSASSSSTGGSSVVYPASSSTTPCTTSTGSTSSIGYPASSSSTEGSSVVYPASSSSTPCTTSTGSSSIEYPVSSSSSLIYPTGGSSIVYTTSTGAPYPPYPTTGYHNTTKPCTSSSTSSIGYPIYPSSSSSGAGYIASSSKKPGYPVPSSSSKAPSYPTTTEKPVGYSHSSGTKTVYTTSYVDICSTGFTTKYTTVTTTSYPEATPKSHDVPEGWYTTVTVCTHCGAYPTTVTLTKPFTKTIYETEYVKPTGYEYTPAPSSAYPEESKPYPSAPAPGKPYPETPEKATTVAISATSTVYKYVTLTKVPIPASEAYPAGTPSPAPYVPVAGEPSPVPYGAGNGTTIVYPSGTATGSVPYNTYAPVEFEGAASRFQVGVSAVAVVVAAFLAL